MHEIISSLKSRLSQVKVLRYARTYHITEAIWDEAKPLTLQGNCGETRVLREQLVLKRAVRGEEEGLENEYNMHIWLWERFPSTYLKYISEPVRVLGTRILTTGQVYIIGSKQLCSVEYKHNDHADEIARQVATAWFQMHQLGVAHLDMHAGNVLYDEGAGHIVIIDFGFMHHLRDRDAFAQLYGYGLHDNYQFAVSRGRKGSSTMQRTYGANSKLKATLVHYDLLGGDREGYIDRMIELLLNGGGAFLWSLRNYCVRTFRTGASSSVALRSPYNAGLKMPSSSTGS